MITDRLNSFIKEKLEQLNTAGLDVSNLELDHFGYQTSSANDYDTKLEEVIEIASKKSENIVSGRRVGIFKLTTPYAYNNFIIGGFELVEPREGQVCNSQLDHLEFVLNESFEKYIERYPTINWDTTAMHRPEFAKLTVKFKDGTSVKFHLKHIFEEIPIKPAVEE